MEDSAYSTAVTPVVEYFKVHPLLHQGSPMLYQAYNELDHSRLPDVIESINGPEDMFCEELARDARVNTYITKEQEHNADVMLGLVYMMVGGVDEAHDLVLPYSLPFDSEWGGPAILDSPALGNATYSHALVHRTEGKYVGELGMIGWENARSWFNETPSDHVLFKRFSDIAENTALKFDVDEKDKALMHEIKGGQFWNWESLTELFSRSCQSDALTLLCNELHNLEISMVLEHCNGIVNVDRKTS